MTFLPPSLDAPQTVQYSHDIVGGAAWSVAVKAGREITLTALGDDANLSMLILGPDRLDRLNIPDTLKAQMSACVSAPMVLMSDRGLGLASVTHSTVEWHDALTGFGHDVHLERFGPTSYALDRNEWRRSGRTGLLSEFTKHGLAEADLAGCVNFFTKIEIIEDSQCSLSYLADNAIAGDTVTLRTELDLLLFMSTAPHPMNPQPYSPAGVRFEVAIAAPAAADDASILFRAESARALEQSRRILT